MSEFSDLFRASAAKSDAKRDAGLTQPANVEAWRDLPYLGDGTDKWNLLDVYRPKNTKGALPVIVSTHGGGYVYGTKEVYQFYGMYLAQQGFAVLNFNYHLAPEAHFPTQLAELNAVLCWAAAHAEEYGFDMNNVFLVGDSAGAQLTSHYAALYANPDFAALYPFKIAQGVTVRAVALNCGMYDLGGIAFGPQHVESDAVDRGSLYDDYFGPGYRADPELAKMADVLGAIDGRYPPAFVMTSWYDFLRTQAEPMAKLLQSRGVEAEYHLYGTAEQKYMGHVFHCNMRRRLAKTCNKEECAFFRRHIVK